MDSINFSVFDGFLLKIPRKKAEHPTRTIINSMEAGGHFFV
jgi:hypothetical protein